MSITLNATLKTAQDGISHRPIVSLLTSPMQAAIPFRGNYFNTDTTMESNRDLIVTSAGRLAGLYIYDEDPDTYNLYYHYSDTDRTEWQTPVDMALGDILHASLCELTDGNIGIVVVKENYDLGYLVISPTGSVVTAYAAISTGNSWIGGVSVITLANDTYLLVYADGDAEPPGDSDNYYLQKRTSSNFTSWGSASALSLAGLTTTNYKDNPDLLQLTGGRIYLHFDYLDDLVNGTEIRNIYRMISDDNGSTWTNPTAVTEFDEAGTLAINPSAAEKSDGNITLTYAEQNNVMRYYNMDGSEDVDWIGNAFVYDSAQQLIIGLNQLSGFTPSVVAIDTATHSFLGHWDLTTSPPFYPNFYHAMYNQNQACKYPFYLFHEGDDYGISIQVLNYVQDSIIRYKPGTDFEIDRIGDYGTSWWENPMPFVRIVSENDRRLYIAYRNDHWGIAGPEALLLGYIDLDEAKDPITQKFTWHEIAYLPVSGQIDGFNAQNIESIWWEESIQRYVLFHSSTERYDAGVPTQYGGIALIDDNGLITHAWNHTTDTGMPLGGAHRGVFIPGEGAGISGSFWFTFQYYSAVPDRRGLCRFHVDTGAFTYHQPNWYTCEGDCLFSSLELIDNDRILMVNGTEGCDKGGVVIFDTTDFSWTHYSNDNLPGMLRSPPCSCDDWANDKVVVQYNETTKTIFYAYQGRTNPAFGIPSGISFFSEYGAYSILKYLTIADPDTTPIYGSPQTLSYYSFEYNPAIAIDGEGYAWFTWDHLDSQTENSLKWDNTMSDKQVEDYLVEDSTLQIEWEVDKPNKLTFELSHGHLFDPLNYLSIWSVYFKMGRLLTLQLGEIVSDTDYLQAQGEFIVKESSLIYSQGYPTIKIIAEDLRSPWEDTRIITSEYYSGITPKGVTESLLVDHGGLIASDYNIPTYNETHDLYHQFVDMDLDEAIQLIMDHFGYFGFVNVNAEFEPRQIIFSGTPDHIYTGTEIVEFTPDSKYATWTNRVVVTGMSNVYSEMLYELESIKSISGTVGHWGGDKDLYIYYSDDKQRTCRDPRLEIIMSVSEFQVWGIKGGGSEEISGVDINEQYVIITIEIPDLTGLLIAAVVALVALGIACIGCDGFIVGWCGACIFAITTLLNLVLLILGAVASYSYTIWARPIGHERATFQAQADDEEFQQQLNGKIITETIDDPFCYVISRCQLVADFEIEVVKAQRKRLKFKKTGHLMDEIGDILRVDHPYSGEEIDVFVTKLKRAVKIGGEITDNIEGWRLS